MSKIDPKSIFNSAESFYRGAKIILESAGKQMFDPNSTTFQLPILPCITNMAFSLELYLKCLFAIENVNIKRTHKIYDLYKLSKKTKSEIAKNILEYKEFEKNLEEISNAFEEWRYSYEKEKLSIDINKIDKAIIVFHDMIIQIHPDWV